MGTLLLYFIIRWTYIIYLWFKNSLGIHFWKWSVHCFQGVKKLDLFLCGPAFFRMMKSRM